MGETEEQDGDNNNDKEASNSDKENDDGKPTPIYVQARKLFNQHEVHEKIDLKWKPCQKEELTKFLVDDSGFNADRVRRSIEKLERAFKANSKPQSRMDSFFAIKPNPNVAKIAAKKRKERLAAAAAAAKRKKSK